VQKILGLTFSPTTKIFDLENSPTRWEENYVFPISSNNHHLDMTKKMTLAPIVTENSASVPSDMCSTV